MILSTSAGFTLEIMYVRSGICCECFWLQVLLCSLSLSLSLSLYLGCRLIMLFFLALLRVASCVLLFRRGHEPNTLMQLRNVEEVRFVDCTLGWIQRAKQFVLYDTLIYIQLYDCHIYIYIYMKGLHPVQLAKLNHLYWGTWRPPFFVSR